MNILNAWQVLGTVVGALILLKVILYRKCCKCRSLWAVVVIDHSYSHGTTELPPKTTTLFVCTHCEVIWSEVEVHERKKR
jgi:hypothetical protein